MAPRQNIISVSWGDHLIFGHGDGRLATPDAVARRLVVWRDRLGAATIHWRMLRSRVPYRLQAGGGILAQPVGEVGHGVEPASVDGERAHAVEGRGLAIDGAGGRPGGAPGELVLADLIGGQGGAPRGAAEARGEMGDPAAGGALGPKLPDLARGEPLLGVSPGF